MRSLFLLAALAVLATFAPPELFREPVLPPQPQLWFEPVPLDSDNPGRSRIGPLAYLGGWSLRSDDPRYGGISALHVEAGEVLALSDAGILFRHALPGGRQGLLLEIRPLVDGPGDPKVKKDRDTEAMVVGGEHLWAAFERRNAVWRYDRATLNSDAHAAPTGMRQWSKNAGAEAMVRLPRGRFLIVAEGSRRGEGLSDMLLFEGDPALDATEVTQLAYRPPAGYRVTDAALLPDGRLLFLHRRFSYLEGISAKLSIIDPSDLKEGAIVSGAEIAHFEPPLTVDNFEGLSVTREGERKILWIASDDNFIAFQRTLLLKFALAE